LIEDRTIWHPALTEALKMTYREFREWLQFVVEHQLTTEPLRIDVVIIKKNENILVDTPTGRIFREYNIFEYKSPTDYLSEWDFLKVHAYTYLYASLAKVGITNFTISFVLNHYPRDVFKYLETLGHKIIEEYPGIYYIIGGIVPIQVILNHKLVGGEKLWLGSLRDDLTAIELTELIRISLNQNLLEGCKAFFDVILKENPSIFKEVLNNMGSKELRDVLEETGLTAEWVEKGIENGKIQVAVKMIKDGFSLHDVSKYSDIPVEKLKELSIS
jgi:hypothetical protein